MDSFQPPPPLLPDLVSPMNIPPNGAQAATMNGCFQKQQVVSHGNNCQEVNNHHMQTIVPNDDTVVQLMMDCSMDAPGDSGGVQSNSAFNWPPATPSSSSSTTFNDYPPHQQCFLPPPPSPPPQPRHATAPISQPSQLPDIDPSMVVEEFEKVMIDTNDKVVLTNSVILLFRFSIDSVRGHEVCQKMSVSSVIMDRFYYVLTNDQFKDDDTLIYATGNLTNISKYDEGRAAILGRSGSGMRDQPQLYRPLIRSLQSRNSNVVIFAITAIHNLLLDRRVEIQELAKEQIKVGIPCIVKLLDNQWLLHTNNECLIHNYEFKVIVLDCLQILAYGNRENRLTIRTSGGPLVILRTIEESLYKLSSQPTEELAKTLETASRVLKSLSACTSNKVDIIEKGGISILTDCIRTNNHEILKTCLWTLRNLSDVINNNERTHGHCIELVQRLLHILEEYSDEPCIITCALGILANITCNNEAIKQLICEYNGIDLLLNTVENALGGVYRDFRVVDREILQPAVCALCHLMNQTPNPNLAEDSRTSIWRITSALMNSTSMISDDLSKAVEKLKNLTFNPQ